MILHQISLHIHMHVYLYITCTYILVVIVPLHPYCSHSAYVMSPVRYSIFRSIVVYGEVSQQPGYREQRSSASLARDLVLELLL